MWFSRAIWEKKSPSHIPVKCLVSMYFRKGKQRSTSLSKVKLTVLALSCEFCVSRRTWLGESVIYLACFWYLCISRSHFFEEIKDGGLSKMLVTHGSGREQGLPSIGCLGTPWLDVLGPGYSHLGNYPNFLKMCENVLSKSYQFP